MLFFTQNIADMKHIRWKESSEYRVVSSEYRVRETAQKQRSHELLEMGGRSYPVRHYPIAIRLRDRMGRAILCLRLSSKWGLVGRYTRSAFRRTPSPTTSADLHCVITE